MSKWPVSLSPPHNVLYLFCHRASQRLPQGLAQSWAITLTHRGINGQPSYEKILPWNVGRSPGSSCQHFCISLIKLLHEWGLDLETAGSSGRWPLTTFTIICKMLFSSVKQKHTNLDVPAKGITSLFSKTIKSALGWKFVFTPSFLDFLSIGENDLWLPSPTRYFSMQKHLLLMGNIFIT